ncbi:MAG: gliding motility-associated C-terminal domain-containing protein [Candidatus Latescibacteria bacterium]|nr:gliding motility-associated C-terminal domain-containing protein [Candidatus Latescibacterota bacterium]
MRLFRKPVLMCVMVGFMACSDAALGELSTWTVGNDQRLWEAWGQGWNMDFLAEENAIQPRVFRPDENAVAGFEGWYGRKFPVDPAYTDGDPRAWEGILGGYARALVLVDGDGATARTFSPRDDKLGRFWSLDFGVAIPACKVVFYPRQEGVDLAGNPTVENYTRGYKLSGGLGEDFPSQSAETYYLGDRAWYEDLYHFEHMLGQTYDNIRSMVAVEFPSRFMRFFRLQNIVNQTFEIAEMEVYADGFAAVAEYTSGIIDIGHPMNFGKIGWTLSKWRRVEGQLVAAPDAPVSISVATRSGTDDMPLVYHKILRTGGEKEITKEEYYSGDLQPVAARDQAPKPGQQGSITDDQENWSAWSFPYTVPGEEIISPGACRYFQFRVILKTDATDEIARLDSLFFEMSPALADQVLGEVSVLDDPTPSDNVAQVVAGERTTFAYDVRATLSPGQSGFDGLEIATPSQALLRAVLMGDPLVALPSDEYEVDVSDPQRLIVLFPSLRIADETPIRLVFDTSVLILGTWLTGKVFDTKSADFAQPIEPGNAYEGVSTDQLTVFIGEDVVGAILDSVWTRPEVITPNGDGMHDQTEICYRILRMTGEAEVELSVYDLSGIRVRRLFKGGKKSGIYEDGQGAMWDGRNDAGERVSPGVYFYHVSIETDEAFFNKSGTIPVVY